MNLRSISLHPKLGAAFDAFVSIGLLLWLPIINNWIVLLLWLLLRLVTWMLLIGVVYYPPTFSRARHFVSLTMFWFGTVFMLIFIDRPALWYMVCVAAVFLSAASFALVPSGKETLSFMIKPWRRSRLMMTVFGLMGIFSGMFAVSVFQILPPLTWWVPIVSGIFAAVVAEWWWTEYDVTARAGGLSLVVFALVFAELVAIIGFWPLGHFASGLIITWLWYVCWLMVRFHLSSEGINWKKQTPFLVINVVLLLAFLILLRWR